MPIISFTVSVAERDQIIDSEGNLTVIDESGDEVTISVTEEPAEGEEDSVEDEDSE